MNKKHFAILIAAALLIGCLAIGAAAADPVATIGSESYETLQAAINAYSNESTAIKLVKDTAEAITVSKDVYLDLNGCDVTGGVTVTGGTLYCLDSQTDDYTIEDARGYGILRNVTGSVAGIPVEATCAEDGYLMVQEENTYSFHRVNLKIYAMSLRAENVGLYYKSEFAGDELVAGQVEKYGVALSVKDVPTTENISTACKCTEIDTEFTAGGMDADATSTLLKNVMKPTNADFTNSRNSKIAVHGRAYILTKNSEYVFGSPVKRSLLEQVEAAASDAYWPGYSDDQKDAAVSMYRQYSTLIKNWNVTNIESRMCLNPSDPLPPENKGSLKVLAITSSFGLNTTQLLYDIAVAEGYEPENVTVARLYTSGCTLEKHIRFAPDKPVYQYTKISGDPDIVSEYSGTVGKMATLKKEGEATLLDGLLDEKWDVIFMQQGARVSSIESSYVDANGNDYITQLRAIMKPYVEQQCPDARFIWNMLWAYDKGSPEYPYSTTFNSDQMAMYQGSINSTMKYVVPRTDYDRIIPSGTAIQNARTSYFGETLSRDTYHLNNLGGTIAGYGLYAVITGQEITEINLDIVKASNTNGIGGAAKINTPFTEEDKLVIMESVNNALKNPFGVTESKHPPVDYSGYNYTDDLAFFGDTKIAVCPACKAKVTWTEVTQENHVSLGFGTQMDAGHYHFYLSEDVEYTGTANAFIYSPGSGRTFCLHLNGNDLTATKQAISVTASNTRVNIMGTGTVSGNHTHSSKFRGSAIVLNSGKSSDLGTVRLYSGTYVQPEGNTQLAPIGTAQQGGLLEIYEDAVIYGNNNSVCLNASNGSNASGNYVETVNIYGGTFYKPLYAYASGAVTSTTSLNISGGTFKDGVTLADANTVLTLSGAPVMEGAGLVLPTGVTVTLGELKTGAKIAVDADGAFTLANSKAADYLQYFSPVAAGSKISVSNNVLYCRASSIYTPNLTFAEDGVTATCPACGTEQEWTAVNQTNLSSNANLCTASTMAKGTYHIYLSSDITYEGPNFFMNMGASERNVCLHLNGNDLTTTGNGIAVLAGTSQLNIMGTGTVSGNHTHSLMYRGSAIVLNAGTTTTPGTVRLYSGTYVQPAENTQMAPVSTGWQAGLLEIYEDATLIGNDSNYSLCVNTTNGSSSNPNKYIETVNIYGGTFTRPVYCYPSDANYVTPLTSLNISGGVFHDGIKIVGSPSITLSGAPVIKGIGLKLEEGVRVNLGTLTTGASIAMDASGAFTVANTLAADYVQYFSTVQNGFSITAQDNVLYCTNS